MRDATNQWLECLKNRLTWWVSKKIAQNLAQPIFLSTLLNNIHLGKKKAKILGYFCNFYETAQSNRSPVGRKFAQSGHPVEKWPFHGSEMEFDWSESKKKKELINLIVSHPNFLDGSSTKHHGFQLQKIDSYLWNWSRCICAHVHT
jgi:hypothetical protein